MKTFFVYPNMSRVGAKKILPKVCAELQKYGGSVILPLALEEQDIGIKNVRYLETAEAIEIADMGVVLGGDGTMLRIAQRAAQKDLPLLGINIGHVGFITELEPEEIFEMRKLFSADYSIDSRMMLHMAVYREGELVQENDALNDVIVAKGAAFRVVHIKIDADNEVVTSFSGDGVIVSTPTGTTAYGLSAGGPIIEPSAENIAVTPICAHALHAKAFVFSPERMIRISGSCETKDAVFVAADGGESIVLGPNDWVEITRSKLTTKLIRLKGNSFYHILQQKL